MYTRFWFLSLRDTFYFYLVMEGVWEFIGKVLTGMDELN